MTYEAGLPIAGAVIIGAWIIAKSIDEAAKRIGERLDNNSRLLDRVGMKLDSLYSPLQAISNKLWEKGPDWE